MLLRVDPQSDRPIYYQIASSIARQIEEGSLASGERLPSARTLAASLGVNMHTVLKAYSHLEDVGQVEMRRGRGGVVVREAGKVEEAARGLVVLARRARVSKSHVVGMIEEAWR